MCSNNHGRGLWRANPRLATNSFFVNQLYRHLDNFHLQLASSNSPTSPQLIWDDIKSLTRTLAQKKRNRILRTYKSMAILNDRLSGIEDAISTLQQEVAEHQALLAGLRCSLSGHCQLLWIPLPVLRIGNCTLTRLRKLYCPDLAILVGGRPKKLGAKTMSLVSRGLRSGTCDSPGAAQESLKLMGQNMSISGIRKSLRRNGFKSRRKVKTNFVSKTNKRLRLGNDGGVMFWSCITAEGPGYGTTIIDGSINSDLYVDILKTSLVDTLEHFRKTPSDVRFQQDKATPHTSGITKQ
ncbi:MFS domain-containing protein [Mucor velutinosus]|uniref:MFS domain-containing protein n=1 Tax=Mucor velutinosus TaxID=708070 RepID=A0AAN7DJI9_9FUNG|nr:MFS domain-containing protein [Mucor velutinosus]